LETQINESKSELKVFIGDNDFFTIYEKDEKSEKFIGNYFPAKYNDIDIGSIAREIIDVINKQLFIKIKTVDDFQKYLQKHFDIKTTL